MTRLLVLLLFCLTALLAPAANPAAKPPTKPGSTANGRSDQQIETDFRQRLARSKASAENFRIKVAGGVATLEGSTSVIQRKGSATRMAKSAGARAVINNIKISEEARRNAAEKLEKRRVTVTRDQK